MTDQTGESKVVERCPMCWHSWTKHIDGRAHQELNTLGCTTCALCEVTRLSLTTAEIGQPEAPT